jgi:hypothetical protein
VSQRRTTRSRPARRSRARRNTAQLPDVASLERIRLPFGKEFLPALKSGEKTLTTRFTRQARKLQDGVQYVAALPDGTELILTPLPLMDFQEAMALLGGVAGYFRAEALSGIQLPDGTVTVEPATASRARDQGWTYPPVVSEEVVDVVKGGSAWRAGGKAPRLIRLQLVPGTGPQIEKPHLPSCAKAGKLDLYVLPINPGFAKRYVMSVLLWLADLPAVSAIIEKAPTQLEAMQALVDGVVVGGVPLRIPPIYAGRLILLNLAEGDKNVVKRIGWVGRKDALESPKWKEYRKKHVAPKQDRGGQPLPRFGFYEEVLAPAGKPAAAWAAFGAPHRDCFGVRGYNCRQYENGTIQILAGSPEGVGAVLPKNHKNWAAYAAAIKGKCGGYPGTGLQGAPSLAGLLDAWEGAQRAWAGQQVHPTFYRVLAKTTRSLAAGVPVAMVISGPRGQTEGYRISGNNPTVEPVRNMVALGEALLWGNPTRAASQACFLLPPPVLKGMKLDQDEIAGARDYEKLLVGSSVSPLTHFRALAQRMQLRDPESRQRAGQLVLEPPRFFQSTPREEWLTFFGEIPQVQSWPGVYFKLLEQGFLQGLTRTETSAWLKEEQQQLGDYRAIGDKADITTATSSFGQQRRQIEAFTLNRPSGRPPLQIHHLTPYSWAEVDFSTNMKAGTPGAGLVIPTRVTIYTRSQSGKAVPHLAYDLKKIREQHFKAWRKQPKKVLPPLRAQVMLINAGFAAAVSKQQEETPDSPLMSPTAIRALLRAKALPLGSRQWFLALPRVAVARLNETSVSVPGKDGAEPTERTKREVVWSHSPFLGSPASIPRLARDLLRVGVSQTGGTPYLLAVPGEEAQGGKKKNRSPAIPWTSHAVPYLFTTLPVFVKGHGVMMLRPGEDPLPAGYHTVFASAFKFARRSDKQQGAVQAVGEGAEREGRRLKGGRATEATRVATQRQFKGNGFYWLAQQAMQALKLSRVSTEQTKQEQLYEAMKPAWPLIVRKMNERRDGDDQLNPAKSFPFRAGKANDAALERAALVALKDLLGVTADGTLAPEVEDMEASLADDGLAHPARYEVLFTGDDLVHPSHYGLTGEHEEDMGDFFHPEMENLVHAIENPRQGQRRSRARRPRRARRSRGRGRSRENPWSPEETKRVVDWATQGGDLADVTFKPPGSNTRLFEAVEDVFPRRAAQGRLHPADRLAALGASESDLFPHFRAGAVDDVQDAKLRSAVLAVDEGIDATDRAYLARHAALSLEEGGAILRDRMRSKRQAGIITPSGAVCKRYRNTARLKDYTPKLPANQQNTAWILIGPPDASPSGDLTRIMSYRGGYHVDCDMLVSTEQPFSFFLGKAIQGMMLWLAEKPIRVQRLKGGLHLGRIGSAKTRQLWAPGTQLDVASMLRSAYEGETTLRLIPAEAALRPDARALAEPAARADLANYAAAQKGLAAPVGYPSYRRASASKAPAAGAAAADAAQQGASESAPLPTVGSDE